MPTIFLFPFPCQEVGEACVGIGPEFEIATSRFQEQLFLGSMVLIDGLVVHKSEKNTSKVSRHAYTFHIADKHGAEWSAKNW